jgi:hypothetical protein
MGDIVWVPFATNRVMHRWSCCGGIHLAHALMMRKFAFIQCSFALSIAVFAAAMREVAFTAWRGLSFAKRALTFAHGLVDESPSDCDRAAPVSEMECLKYLQVLQYYRYCRLAATLLGRVYHSN